MVDHPSKGAAHWLNRGSELLSECAYADAQDYFDAALAIDSQNPETWNLKGLAFAGDGELSEAIYCYGLAVTINPKFAEAYNNAGCALDDQGRDLDHDHLPGIIVYPPPVAAIKYNAAIVYFDKALSMDQNYADAWNNKGISLFYLGKLQEALNCFNKAIEIYSKSSDALKLGEVFYNQGIIYEDLNESEKAGEAFSRAKDLGFELINRY